MQRDAIDYFIPQAEKVADAAVKEVFEGQRYSKLQADALWNRVFHAHMDKHTAGMRTKGPRCRD